MYISDVRIENYRTFQDVTFHFDSRANYIVGDNNIGKSNFLSFLKTVTPVSYTHLTLPTIA